MSFKELKTFFIGDFLASADIKDFSRTQVGQLLIVLAPFLHPGCFCLAIDISMYLELSTIKVSDSRFSKQYICDWICKRGSYMYTHPIFQLFRRCTYSCFKKDYYSSKLQECIRPLFADLVTFCSYSLIVQSPIYYRLLYQRVLISSISKLVYRTNMCIIA